MILKTNFIKKYLKESNTVNNKDLDNKFNPETIFYKNNKLINESLIKTHLDSDKLHKFVNKIFCLDSHGKLIYGPSYKRQLYHEYKNLGFDISKDYIYNSINKSYSSIIFKKNKFLNNKCANFINGNNSKMKSINKSYKLEKYLRSKANFLVNEYYNINFLRKNKKTKNLDKDVDEKKYDLYYKKRYNKYHNSNEINCIIKDEKHKSINNNVGNYNIINSSENFASTVKYNNRKKSIKEKYKKISLNNDKLGSNIKYDILSVNSNSSEEDAINNYKNSNKNSNYESIKNIPVNKTKSKKINKTCKSKSAEEIFRENKLIEICNNMKQEIKNFKNNESIRKNSIINYVNYKRSYFNKQKILNKELNENKQKEIINNTKINRFEKLLPKYLNNSLDLYDIDLNINNPVSRLYHNCIYPNNRDKRKNSQLSFLNSHNKKYTNNLNNKLDNSNLNYMKKDLNYKLNTTNLINSDSSKNISTSKFIYKKLNLVNKTSNKSVTKKTYIDNNDYNCENSLNISKDFVVTSKVIDNFGKEYSKKPSINTKFKCIKVYSTGPFNKKDKLLISKNKNQTNQYNKDLNNNIIKGENKYNSFDYKDYTDNMNNNLLHLASKFNNFKLSKYLVKIGFNCNIKNAYGDTPVMYAAINKNINMLIYFIKNGGDLSIENKNNISPFSLLTVILFITLILLLLIE